jgi:hypothetical protein
LKSAPGLTRFSTWCFSGVFFERARFKCVREISFADSACNKAGVSSRETAKEYSLRRKPWVQVGNDPPQRGERGVLAHSLKPRRDKRRYGAPLGAEGEFLKLLNYQITQLLNSHVFTR